ncbi:MAG: hypothetical protein JST22_21685 [Bacteroidetes bacterium]|nr:hypothetical protein [Bacteroidota bacterium]
MTEREGKAMKEKEAMKEEKAMKEQKSGRAVAKTDTPPGRGAGRRTAKPETISNRVVAPNRAVAEWERAHGRRSAVRELAERVRVEVGNRKGRRVWMPAFLAVLARTANVQLSCYAAGISRQLAYDCRSRDGAFREAWETALDTAIDRLEEEAWSRACEGVERYVISYGRPVLDESGQPLVERHYSDMLLERLLRAHRPQKYRETPGAGDVQTVVKVYSGFDPDSV